MSHGKPFNVNAIALYEAVGFETEGLHRNAVRIDGPPPSTFNRLDLLRLSPQCLVQAWLQVLP
jgi:RimJ/RimL family protein N-acetyltransferase